MTVRIKPSRSAFLASILALATVTAACAPAPATPVATTPVSRPAVAISAEKASVSNIQQTLNLNGDLRAMSQITVLPKVSGRVQNLMVDVGTNVKAGDVLAELEADNSELQVLQSRAALAAAEAKLSQIQAGGRADDVAAARAGVASAQARLDSMHSGARSEDLAIAQASYDQAVAKLELLQKGATNDRRVAAQAQVERSKANVVSAEAAVDNLQSTIAADTQAAQSAVENAKSVQGSADAGVKSAEASLVSAKVSLSQLNQPIKAQILTAESTVQQAIAAREQARSTQKNYYDSVTGLSGRCATDADSAACQAARAAADRALESADKAVETAEAQLKLLREGGTASAQAAARATVAAGEASVANAKASAAQSGENLKTVEARLRAIQTTGADAQRKAVQAQLTSARESLKTDQATLNQLILGAQPEDIRVAELAVQQAEQQLAKANTPYTEFDIRQQEQAVAQAAASLRSRQNPYSTQDVEAAQAAVEQSRAALDLAQLGVREAKVLSPVDGIVSERNISAGALVGQSTALFVIVPPQVELLVNVEEAMLGQISVGQNVAIEVPAYPGQTFTGQVKTIAPTVDTKSRTSAVRIEPQGEGKLRSGMFAKLRITTAQKNNALVVPKTAIVGGTTVGAQSSVILVEDGNKARKMPVRLGLANDRFVEIVGGLTEGQIVATSGLTELSDGDAVAPQIENRTAQAN